MALSIGRTLYNLLGRAGPAVDVARPPRPAGDLVWLHAPVPAEARATLQLAQRLMHEFGTPVLLTSPDPLPLSAPLLVQHKAPADTAAEARAFLDHWRPDLAIHGDGELRPALLAEAAARRLPLFMVEARIPYLPGGRDGWYPGLMRSCLNSYKEIMVLDEVAARAFHRAGADRVTISGRMEEPSAALPCHEPERAALAQAIATRPVWLAAEVPAAEEAAVIAAHRAALRLAHRLLLILVPDDPARGPELAARIESEEGWAVAQRSRDEEPDVETGVYIPDSTSEFGLWYRLSPVTFLGGSLLGDGCRRSPMEAAALGSALLHGPRAGPFATAIARLGAARGARAVGTPAELGDALAEVLAPDRAARQAQAAWVLASEGVDVTDHVLDLVRRSLDGAA